MISLGPLNHRCRVQKLTTAQDESYGTAAGTWRELPPRWCSYQDMTPSRINRVTDGMVTNQRLGRLRMRYCTDIDSTMRFIIERPNAEVYRIVDGPAELGSKDGVEFLVERISTDG